MTDEQLNDLIDDLTRHPPLCVVRVGEGTVGVYRNDQIVQKLRASREQVLRLERAGALSAPIDL